MAAFFYIRDLGDVTTDPELVLGGKLILDDGEYFEIPGVGTFRKMVAEGVDLYGDGNPVSLVIRYFQVEVVPANAVVVPARLFDTLSGKVREL